MQHASPLHRQDEAEGCGYRLKVRGEWYLHNEAGLPDGEGKGQEGRHQAPHKAQNDPEVEVPLHHQAMCHSCTCQVAQPELRMTQK